MFYQLSKTFKLFLFLGLKPEQVQAGVSLPTTCQLVKESDDSYSFITIWGPRTMTMKFNLNEEFDEDRFDGVKVKSVVTFEGNKMIQQQKGDKALRIERVFTDKELITTSTIDDITSIRWFEVIE